MNIPANRDNLSRLERFLNACSRRLKHHFLLALLACYLLALLAPSPGLALSEPGTIRWPIESSIQTQLLVVAMFLAAYSIGRQTRGDGDRVNHPDSQKPPHDSHHPSAAWRTGWVLGLWRVGLLCLAILMLSIESIRPIVQGLVLVLCMPAAFSTVPWTQKSGGDVKLTLTLLASSILLAPLILTAVFRVTSLGELDSGLSESSGIAPTVSLASIASLWLWFIPPVFLGLATAKLIGKQKREQCQADSQPANSTPMLNLLPPLIILLVNYGSASRVIPQLFEGQEVQLVLASLAIVACFVGVAMVGSVVIAKQFRLTPTAKVSVTYVGSMYNTGMALVLAATLAPQSFQILVPILLFTLSQHIFAAARDRLTRSLPASYCVCPPTITTSPVSISKPR